MPSGDALHSNVAVILAHLHMPRMDGMEMYAALEAPDPIWRAG